MLYSPRPVERRPFPRKVFDRFSKHELQDFLEIMHDAAEARDVEDVERVLATMKRVLPFSRLIAGVVRHDASGFQDFATVLNVSYPNDWLYKYAKNGYAKTDPVLLSLLSTPRTQVWTHTYDRVQSEKQKEFIEEAKGFGLINGVTVSAQDPRHGLASFFSFAGDDRREHARFADAIDYLVHRLHATLLKSAPVPHATASTLSPRELTVLGWMKMGKTNWEIARILGVSERTVRFHVERIFIKLDVTSRAQAVALAMEAGLLSA